MSDFIKVIYFTTNSRDLSSYQNRNDFNSPASKNSSLKRAEGELVASMLPRAEDGTQLCRLLGNGCGSVVVSIGDCGRPFLGKKSPGKRTAALQRRQISPGPSSNLGRGPKPFLSQRKANGFRGLANLLGSQGKKRFAKRTFCFAKQASFDSGLVHH